MNNPINGIVKFQVDRGLDKQDYKAMNEHANILEELVESIGGDIPKEKRQMLIDNAGKLFQNLDIEFKDISVEDEVDAYADIIVFCIGAILKLGFIPNRVLEEVSKEINSRTGAMINGKFEKDLSDEAKSKWYKANYDRCRRDV